MNNQTHNKLSNNKLFNSMGIKGLVLIAALLWGLSFSILKDAITSLPIFWLLSLRFTIGIIFFGLLIIKRLKFLNRKNIIAGICMGSCLFGAYIFQTIGLDSTTPGKNAFLTTIYCVLVPFICFILYRTKLSKYHIMGAILCLIGIAFISIDEFNVNIGDILSLIGGLFFAFHIIVSTKVTKNEDPLLCVFVQMIVIAILCYITSLIIERDRITFDIQIKGWLQLLFLGIGPSALCLAFQGVGNKYLEPTTVSIILSTEAVFGVVFSIILGHEDLTFFSIIGFVLVFMAIIVTETKLSFLFQNKTSNKKIKQDEQEIPKE